MTRASTNEVPREESMNPAPGETMAKIKEPKRSLPIIVYLTVSKWIAMVGQSGFILRSQTCRGRRC